MPPNPVPVRTERYIPVPVGGFPTPNQLTDTSGRPVKVPIGDGKSDVHQILMVLQKLIFTFGQDPRIRQTALSITKPRVNDDAAGHIKNLTQWVKDRVKFVYDPTMTELVVSPLRLIAAINSGGIAYGDCDDHVLLLGSLLTSLGLRVRPVGVKLRDSHRYDHVILSVFYRSQWVDLDPCAKGVMQPRYTERLVIA